MEEVLENVEETVETPTETQGFVPAPECCLYANVDENHKLILINQIDAFNQGLPAVEYERANNGDLYEKGYVPEPTPPTYEEQKENRAAAYQSEVDPITSHIERLRDEEQTEEIVAKINELIAERAVKVEEIKERYPYPVEE